MIFWILLGYLLVCWVFAGFLDQHRWSSNLSIRTSKEPLATKALRRRM